MSNEKSVLNAIQASGLYVFGEYAGTKRGKDSVNRDTGEATPKFFHGIKVPKLDGFEGEYEYIEIRLTKDHIKNGWLNKLQGCKEKIIGIPFRINTFSPRDNQTVYESLFFEESKQIIGFVEYRPLDATTAQSDVAAPRTNNQSKPAELKP